jgi:hypothetical protein
VDCTQSVNVPIVVGDQHMAALASEFGRAKATAEQQVYEEALRAAMDPHSPQRLPRANNPARPPPNAAPRAPRPNTAGGLEPPLPSPENAAPETPVTLEPLDGLPPLDSELALPRAMWPDYPCNELGGLGWRVLLLAASPAAATVRFIHARSWSGRRYKDTQVQTSALMLIKPLNTLDQQGP